MSDSALSPAREVALRLQLDALRDIFYSDPLLQQKSIELGLMRPWDIERYRLANHRHHREEARMLRQMRTEECIAEASKRVDIERTLGPRARWEMIANFDESVAMERELNKEPDNVDIRTLLLLFEKWGDGEDVASDGSEGSESKEGKK
ncbi:hypothetical protein KEM55_006054 [Ascosphaera atra]|nr:hypothetical protein KEM55_006054 [Ascosphaera atra]